MQELNKTLARICTQQLKSEPLLAKVKALSLAVPAGSTASTETQDPQKAVACLLLLGGPVNIVIGGSR